MRSCALPRKFVAAIRTVGLDTLLAGSEIDGVNRVSLVKSAIDRAAFDIEWDAATADAEYRHKIFCLYDYDTGRVYGCDEQVGYVSVCDLRTYRWVKYALTCVGHVFLSITVPTTPCIPSSP